MLTKLLQAIEENELAQMLRWPIEDWRSVDITFHPPHVERLWRPWEKDYRINLQVIHPCKPEQSLWHPHATPITIRVAEGLYKAFTGFGPGEKHPPNCYYQELAEGSYSEMIHPDAWHAECPEETVLTIALTGKPWQRPWVPKSPHKLGELSPARKAEIIAMFVQIYS